MSLSRRSFFKTSIVLAISSLLNKTCKESSAYVMTVNGPIKAKQMANTLIHEHLLVDFIGAKETGYHRWNKEEVLQVILPYLEELKKETVKPSSIVHPLIWVGIHYF